MLLGHMQLTIFVQVLAWNIMAFLCSHYIVKCPFQVPLTVMCIYCYQSFSHQCSVPTLESGGHCVSYSMCLCICGLFSSHFTLSAISYTLPCGCKQGEKVFVMRFRTIETF